MISVTVGKQEVQVTVCHSQTDAVCVGDWTLGACWVTGSEGELARLLWTFVLEQCLWPLSRAALAQAASFLHAVSC